MKKDYYSCDCGSVQVECGGSFIRYSNGYGDGMFKIYLFDNREEFNNYVEEHEQKYGVMKKDYHWLALDTFKNARVLNYDCLQNASEEVLKENTVFVLNGEYQIYYNFGKVYFVKNEWLEVNQ